MSGFDDDLVALKSTQGPSLRDKHAQAGAGTGSEVADSLVNRCISVIVANLERYPSEAIGVLDEHDWESIIKIRHKNTRPKKHTAKIGGLDGTGRIVPALSDKFITEVEESNPHLAESPLIDNLIWMDCVNYRFKQNGLTRPKSLLFPWPLLVQFLSSANKVITNSKLIEKVSDIEDLNRDQRQQIENAIYILRTTPMNVALLKASGIGKSIKKFIRNCQNSETRTIFHELQIPMQYAVTTTSGGINTNTIEVTATTFGDANTSKQTVGKPGCKKISAVKCMEKLLESWMDMATSHGVKIKRENNNCSIKSIKAGLKGDRDRSASSSPSSVVKNKDEHLLQEDLINVESCHSWRHLFKILKDREEKRRESQGAKMREIRKNLNTIRPKVMKVRPAKSKHINILEGRGSSRGNFGLSSSTTTVAGANILKLRKETAVTSSRSRAPSKPSSAGGFGQAVAFAQASKVPKHKRKEAPTNFVRLGKDKLMKTPLLKGHNRGQGSHGAARTGTSSRSNLLKKMKR